MKKIFAFVAATTLGLLVAAPASAYIILFDPDSYAPGTNISNAVEGVTLSTWSATGFGAPALSPVFARSNPLCETDPRLCDAVSWSSGFSQYADGYGQLWTWGGADQALYCFTSALCREAPFYGEWFEVMLIAFDRPTDFVEISGRFIQDNAVIYAFDASHNRLFPPGAVTTTSFRNCEGFSPSIPLDPTCAGYRYNYSTSWVLSDSANISYVIAGGWSGGSSLDVLRFNVSVPEPGTLALLGLGLVGLGFARRRRLS